MCNWRKGVSVSPEFQDRTFWQIRNRAASSHSTCKDCSIVFSAAEKKNKTYENFQLGSPQSCATLGIAIKGCIHLLSQDASMWQKVYKPAIGKFSSASKSTYLNQFFRKVSCTDSSLVTCVLSAMDWNEGENVLMNEWHVAWRKWSWEKGFSKLYRDVPKKIITNILSPKCSWMPFSFRPINKCYRPICKTSRIFHLVKGVS